MPVLKSIIVKLSNMTIKLVEHPSLKDPRKRQGLASNYAQILTSVVYIKSIDDFEPVKKLIITLKTLTDTYSSFLNPRDLAELVAAVC